MKNSWLKYPVRFAALLLLQVLVLNNLNLGGYIHPLVYVLFILLLPVQMNKNLVLVIAFFTGLTVDYFANTLGLHAGSSVFLAYLRPGVLNLFFKPVDFSQHEELGVKKIGWGGFFRYTIVLVFFHHLALFAFETLEFSNFHITLLRIGASTLVTTVGILMIMMLFSPKR